MFSARLASSGDAAATEEETAAEEEEELAAVAEEEECDTVEEFTEVHRVLFMFMTSHYCVLF